MRITEAEVVSRRIPLADDFPVSYEEHVDTEHLFVRLHTDAGLVGDGEGTALPWFTGETLEGMVAAAEDWLLPTVVGADLEAAAAAFDERSRAFPGNPGAKAAVDLALLDLRGKRAEVPVRELLGPTVREEIPLIYPIPGVSAERARELVEEGIEAGFDRFKIKATGDIDADVARIDAVTERLPEAGTARVDPNTSWQTAPRAMGVLERLAHPDRLEYLEQPVRPDRPADLRTLWESTGTPVFADEFVHEPRDVTRLGEEGLAAGCHLKLAKTGSLTQMASMAETANRYGMAATAVSAFGTSLEATAICHLASVIREIPLACELDPGLIGEDPTTAPFEIRPTIPVPEGPGLGIELSEELF